MDARKHTDEANCNELKAAYQMGSRPLTTAASRDQFTRDQAQAVLRFAFHEALREETELAVQAISDIESAYK